ncbi:TIGR02265 family protein [Archangium minus]|uniref:TIGR02265 family protein n=1 Tax=Archangium minus TaxID=83450 RepID=A0ABY9X230_9BACT|nr:TIGR02265 family protein [Archangium violaceum]WNG49446.1 TIGR02265 family protein [Archangium minus]
MESQASTWSAVSYDWKHDCEMRLVHVGAQDTVRGTFLNGTLQAIRTLGGEPLEKECLAACGHERFVEGFSYSISVHLRMISTAMPELMVRCGSSERVLRYFGRRAAMDFLASPAGRMMLTLAKRDPKQLLSSLPSAYKASVSYGEKSIEWTGPKSGRVVLKREFLPHAFHAGMVELLLEVVGASRAKVFGRQTGRLDSVCEFSWE